MGWARQCEVRTSSMRSAWLPGELIEGRNAPSPALASLKARGRPPLSIPHPAWSGQCLPAAVPTTGHNAHRRPRATAGAEPRADALRAANNAVRNISRYAITYRNGHDPILPTAPHRGAPPSHADGPPLFSAASVTTALLTPGLAQQWTARRRAYKRPRAAAPSGDRVQPCPVCSVRPVSVCGLPVPRSIHQRKRACKKKLLSLAYSNATLVCWSYSRYFSWC